MTHFVRHQMSKKKLQSIVVSDKMQKTVVVEVERVKEHPKYKRRFKVHKKYKAHDEKGEFHTGDTVMMEATRPLSREKRWRITKKITINDKQSTMNDNNS